MLADDILSFWIYVEKYLEFFASLTWCVCLQLSVIFSTNMWPILTELFPCQCLLSCEKCEVLSAASFRTYFLTISALALWQIKNCYVMKTWKDTLWNKEAWFLAKVHLTFILCSRNRRPGTRVSLMPSTSALPTNPWDGVSRLQQPLATG